MKKFWIKAESGGGDTAGDDPCWNICPAVTDEERLLMMRTEHLRTNLKRVTRIFIMMLDRSFDVGLFLHDNPDSYS